MKTKVEIMEERIISFLDGELTAQEAEHLMDEISENETYQSLLSAYEQTYLHQETEIVFADKSKLLKPERAFVLPLKPIIGIAAGLILLMGLVLTWQHLRENIQKEITVEQHLVQTPAPKTETEIEKKEEKSVTPNPTPAINKSIASPVIPKNIAVQKDEGNENKMANTTDHLIETNINPYQNIDKINNNSPAPHLLQKQEIEIAYIDFPSLIQNKTGNNATEVEVKIAGVDISDKMNEVQFIRARLNEIKDKATEGLSLLQDASKPKFLNSKNSNY